MKLQCRALAPKAAPILIRRATAGHPAGKERFRGRDYPPLPEIRDDARDHVQLYRRVRPPFRLAVQKDGRWPRAGAARERLVSSWRGQTLAARRHPSLPAMPCAAFEVQHLLGLVNPIEPPSAIRRVGKPPPIQLAQRLPSRPFCCCFKHGYSRIISPIDDIDDEY